MSIAIGSDHAGFPLKEHLKKELQAMGLEARDFGTHSTDSCDYPDIAHAVSRAVAKGECESGILICGTGIGVSITANKVTGIRAACVSDPYSARMAREHNDANILCLGERVVGQGLAGDILRAWLGAAFAGGRHQRRVDKIGQVELEYRGPGR